MRPPQSKKGSRLLQHIAQMLKPQVQGEKIEKVAMLAGGGVGPFAGGAFPAIRSGEPDVEAAARRVRDVATQ